MKLILDGHGGARACDWSGYALLRDNVQHFIEEGTPTPRFAALHEIETAVDAGRCSVDAARLRNEVLRAWYMLWAVPLVRAAVSLRTRAILTGSDEVPPVDGTVCAERAGWQLPVDSAGSEPVAGAAKRFVAVVLSVTDQAGKGDVVEVRRHGSPPRFAASLRRVRGTGSAREEAGPETKGARVGS